MPFASTLPLMSAIRSSVHPASDGIAVAMMLAVARNRAEVRQGARIVLEIERELVAGAVGQDGGV
jgi:hypothetical protein